MNKPLVSMRPLWNWGMLLPSRGHARCYRCRKPWWSVKEWHDIEYAPGRTQFALCEPCWQKSDTDLRWHAHNWASRHPSWSSEDTWTVLFKIEGLR